ncbi:hypothetical protein HNP37_002742 [Flavobacterium nitrogenifigens]|uniref:Uncharacterized protein n=2 Tax=Flavobacterium TaxID=237 RepID=A0A7W7N8Q7_9FLAO|nr:MULTISPECIES: hypothetical protein [Flavobacterium]MBB4802667.1 hypothetical protein [Flavobacterium nitrogenifigens]MBB6387625.1 hypothetical protein [Flavobacterium notoginsengisoli]
MKNLQVNRNDSKVVCNNRLSVCAGDNNELIFRKTYVGDWGDWDEKPDTTFKDQNCIDRNTTLTSAV